MFRTDDNYNLYYDGMISEDQEANFKTLIEQHQLSAEFAALLKRHYNFSIPNTYGEHKKLLWILFKTLGPFAITILSAEEVHPPGCEYQVRVDFYIEANGNFDYELKNSLFLYDDYGSSDECKERIERKAIGFDKDCRVKANMGQMDLNDFIEKITIE